MATDKKKPADTGKPIPTDTPATERHPKARATKPPAKRAGKRGGGESKHSERRIEAAEETQVKALEYRKMGLSYSQIAEKLGLGSPQTAWNAVESALKRTLQEPADDVRKMELARLDAMWIKPYLAAQAGDTFAVGTCLNIMNRRARLLGLDAPVKTEGKTTLDGNVGGGVLVVGSTMTPEEWTALAKTQQEQLTTDNGPSAA